MSHSTFNLLITALTQFILHCSKSSRYRNEILQASLKIGEGLLQDMFNENPPLPEAYGWPIEQQVVERGFLFEKHKI